MLELLGTILGVLTIPVMCFYAHKLGIYLGEKQ